MKLKKVIGVITLCSLLSVGIVSCSTKSESEANNSSKDTKQEASKSGNKLKKKDVYIEKLDNIKIQNKDLEEKYSGITIEMKEAAATELERWDTALNEIYKDLKENLNKETFNKLEKEEIQWIKDRDSKAENAAKKFEGGTAEELERLSCLVEETKKRCYELVENYME